jgi:hypothetical protein
VGAGHRGGERKSGRCVSAASYRMRGMARAWAEHARGTLCQAGFEKPTIVGVWFYWWPCRTDGDCAGQGVAKEAAARSVPSSLRPYRGGARGVFAHRHRFGVLGMEIPGPRLLRCPPLSVLRQ